MSKQTDTVSTQNTLKYDTLLKWFIAILVFGFALFVENSAHSKTSSQALNCDLDKTNTACYETIINDSIYDDPKTQYTRPLSAVYTTHWKKRNKVILKGQKIVVDVTDKKACLRVKNYILSQKFTASRHSLEINNLCLDQQVDETDNLREITILGETSKSYAEPYKMNFGNALENDLVNETRNVAIMMTGAMGALWVLPEAITNWHKDDFDADHDIFEGYKKNITHKPVYDIDSNFINYVAHPFSGSVYYSIARNSGLSPLKSFGYSAFISTFFWEYGFEALIEKPSIQDLIITPVIGSIIGEVFYQWSQKIVRNNGQVLGSNRIGSVMMFILSPGVVVSKKINQILGHEFIQNFESDIVIRKIDVPLSQTEKSTYLGFELRFNF